MVAVPLPMEIDHEDLKTYLYDQHHIEVLTHTWQDQPYLRVSFQAYNQVSDLEALLAGLESYLSKEKSNHEIN
jgi:selenocysteine lyase/cysteine desulfurase